MLKRKEFLQIYEGIYPMGIDAIFHSEEFGHIFSKKNKVNIKYSTNNYNRIQMHFINFQIKK